MIQLAQTAGDVVDKGINAAATSLQTTGVFGAIVVLGIGAWIILERYSFKPRRAESRLEREQDRALREKELMAAVEAAKSIQGATQAAQAASQNAQETTKVAAQMVAKLTEAYERVEVAHVQRRDV